VLCVSTRMDIAIAGAGVGGLAAALAMHRLGHRITVYEQFDTPRAVGSGLIMQPTGLGVLDDLGLGHRLRNLGARIDRLTGTASGSGRTVLDVRYAAIGEQRGYAVHRAALFSVLFDGVKAEGIRFETSQRVEQIDAGRLLFANGQSTPGYDLVIDALGTQSPLKQQTYNPYTLRPLEYGAVWASLPWPASGFDPHALEQRYSRANIMLGVLPIGSITEGGQQQAAFFWSLKAKDHETWKQRGLTAWKEDVLHHWPQTAPLLEHIQSTDDLTLARYQHHTLDIPYGKGFICIGDSAHATSPQLGQGANNALLDVKALIVAMARHKNLEDIAAAYTKSRRRHVLTYQALSYLFTPFYQSDSKILPLMRDSVVSTAAKIPVAQRILAHMVAGTLVEPIHARI
jgi:2-polyprenyl-6-methoxyphenol hydroxylase-like FAD-dependent oxidoreductase